MIRVVHEPALEDAARFRGAAQIEQGARVLDPDQRPELQLVAEGLEARTVSSSERERERDRETRR